MGFYGGGWVQKMMNIQSPAKILLSKIGLETLSPEDAKELIKLLKAAAELPKIDKEKITDPNTRILIEVWEDDFKKHLTKEFLQHYEPILDALMNFAISKFDYDNFYKGLTNRLLGELIRKGWQFPGHNRPNSVLWESIPADVKNRLSQSLRENYSLLQTRLKSIDDKLPKGDKEGDLQRASRFEQFVNRVLTDVEREVIAWN